VHDATFDAIEHADEALLVMTERYRAHEGATHVAVFKNQGPRSGASIPHVHSQVVPLPFVPPRIQRELAGFMERCPLCTPEGSVIRETRSFRWLAPSASAFAFQQWIVPRRHVAEMTALEDEEITELSSLLRSASAAMLRIVPSYTWTFLNFRAAERAHFYIDLFPRIAAIAGLELGTGTFVEIIDPAAAALRLREQS
jgi:UDPglucose--hexose-1-phosphate uridylyltransferase